MLQGIILPGDIDMEASLHVIVTDLILIASAIYMAISYLVIVKYVRRNKIQVGSLKVINFYYVYKNYIQERKRHNLTVGVLFFMHIISILTVLILGYFMEGKGI